MPQIHFYEHDLPANVIDEWRALGCPDVAVDTEATGLHLGRDRLLMVQLCFEPNVAHLIHFPQRNYSAPHLRTLLSSKECHYLFHFGRFDIAMISLWLEISFNRVYCTKIASRLVRTYTDSHSLGTLCFELLGTKLDKQAQSSDWAQVPITEKQKLYAANDVLYLHQLRDTLTTMLLREGRMDLAMACFAFLPTRSDLDCAGWNDEDIFRH